MPQRQLNIRSDEAYRRASGLAERLGKTTTEAVVEALRSYEARAAPLDELGFTPEQRDDYEALRELARETSRHKPADLSSDHSWLYDENGLPK